MELSALTIHELNRRLREREITARELLEAVYKRIAAVENQVHAYIALMKPRQRLKQKQQIARSPQVT